MPKRLYQLIALAILIGAPLIVRAVSQAVPGIQEAAAPDTPPPPDEPVAQAPAPPLSPPPPNMPMDATANPADSTANAMVDLTPSLDPQGIAPDALGDVASASTQLSDTHTQSTAF